MLKKINVILEKTDKLNIEYISIVSIIYQISLSDTLKVKDRILFLSKIAKDNLMAINELKRIAKEYEIDYKNEAYESLKLLSTENIYAQIFIEEWKPRKATFFDKLKKWRFF